jgi:magnesium-transporting ATPase (P-type)
MPPSFVMDKTGTLTQNKMSLQSVIRFASTNYTKRAMGYRRGQKVIEIAMWAATCA